MKKWAIPPGQLEQATTRARRLRAEAERKERAVGGRIGPAHVRTP